jgi:hypothetical protein
MMLRSGQTKYRLVASRRIRTRLYFYNSKSTRKAWDFFQS